MQVTPDPTEEEAAAIVAALGTTVGGAAPAPEAEPPRWRFSGRWWVRPIPMRRRRPW